MSRSYWLGVCSTLPYPRADTGRVVYFWELDANSEFAVHCLIWGLHCQGHTNLEFAVHCLIQGLTQDSWGCQGSQWRLVLSEYTTAPGVCCSRRGRSVDTVGVSGIECRSWEVVHTFLTGVLRSCSWRDLCITVSLELSTYVSLYLAQSRNIFLFIFFVAEVAIYF